MDLTMDDDSTPYESILVGYLCEAIGWLRRDAQDRMRGRKKASLLSAMNMSHNPLDPAVGDFVLSLAEPDRMPNQFFLLELKRDVASIDPERQKISKKLDGRTPDEQYVHELEKVNPGLCSAHWLGLYHDIPAIGRKGLALTPYWRALAKFDARSCRHVLRVLRAMMVQSANSPTGMNFDTLVSYINWLNAGADPRGAAAWGTKRFAFAYHQGEVFLFNERSIIEHGEGIIATLKERARLRRVQTPSG